MKRRLKAVLGVSLLVIAVLAVIWLRHQRELAIRYDCLSTLRSTGFALAMYRQDYNGNLPTDFALLFGNAYLSATRMYVCPWNHKAPGAWTNIADWMDYYYVFWPSVTAATANYPLMYDRRLSNHDGKGINILLVEQTIDLAVPSEPESFHGQFFWDEGAKWLQRFEKEHPDLKIPMPEDLKRTP